MKVLLQGAEMLAAFVAEPCAAPDGCNSFADKTHFNQDPKNFSYGSIPLISRPR